MFLLLCYIWRFNTTLQQKLFLLAFQMVIILVNALRVRRITLTYDVVPKM